MRFFLLILFSLILLLPNLSLGAPPFLKIELNFYPELNLLKGNLSTKLYFNENYKFTTSDLFIEEIKATSGIFLSEENEFLKVSNEKDSGFLEISFEKTVNPLLLPITIIYPPFPYPDKPFTYEVTIRLPSNRNIEILMPSEETEIKEEKDFLVYTFKVQTPVLLPCIVLSTTQMKKEKFFLKNFNLYFCYFPQIDNLSPKDFKNLIEELKPLVPYLKNIGGDFSPFKNLYIIVSNNISETKSFSNILLINPFLLKDPKQILHLLAKKKLEDGLFLENDEIKDGLITYLIDYQLAENKKTFRKLKALYPEEKSKNFFYFLFLSQNIGEKELIKLFKKFYEANIFSVKTWDDFLNFVKESYPEFETYLVPYQKFQKLNLEGKVIDIKKVENFYWIHLIINTNSTLIDLVNSIPVTLKIVKESGVELYVLQLKKSFQNFNISVKEKPKAIYLDPEYMLWRNLNFEEIPNSIGKLFYHPGVIFVKIEQFLLYKDIIDFFRNIGYKLSFSLVDPFNNSQELQNLIYLDTPPIPWHFIPPSKGFYLKVIPNPFHPEYSIGYIYISSKDECNSIFSHLSFLNLYSEILLQSGKVLLKREDNAIEGIPIYLSSLPQKDLSPRKVAFNFINSQIIILGVEENSLSSQDFLKPFLDNIYALNTNLILALDLPLSFQKLFEDYFENKVSESQFKEAIKDAGISNPSILLEIINWAKSNKIKAFVIGEKPDLSSKILTKGLKGLSTEDFLNLPEIDLFNPDYKDYLYDLFTSSKDLQKYSFESFYEAQIFKIENLAENIKNLLDLFKDNQIVVITYKYLVDKKYKLAYYLQKRNILNFKILILDSEKLEILENQ